MVVLGFTTGCVVGTGALPFTFTRLSGDTTRVVGVVLVPLVAAGAASVEPAGAFSELLVEVDGVVVASGEMLLGAFVRMSLPVGLGASVTWVDFLGAVVLLCACANIVKPITRATMAKRFFMVL